MTTRLALALLFASLLPAQPKPSAPECAVWQRELAFAQSVENHDPKTFATYLTPGAIFSAATEDAVRGKENVLKSWAGLIEGKTLRLRWHPDVVNIGGNPNIAISRGPYMMEDLRPDAKAKFRVGTFTTIWTRQSATAPWLVLFDAGGPPPTQVDDLQAAEKFMSQAAGSCLAK